MSGFTKLDSGIVHSTIWVQPHDVLRVWVALLALADQNGMARTAAPALAHLCMIPLDRMREILCILESPDEDSRTEANEGRRILKVEGGWQLVNYLAYRNARDPEGDHERKKQWDRDNRPSGHARLKQSDASPTVRQKSDASPTVRQKSDASPTSPTQAEAEAEADKSKSKEQMRAPLRGSRLPTGWVLPADWKSWACSERQDLNIDNEADRFADYWHAKAGKDGCKADWQATWRNWVRNARGSQTMNRMPADRHNGFQTRAYGEGGLL